MFWEVESLEARETRDLKHSLQKEREKEIFLLGSNKCDSNKYLHFHQQPKQTWLGYNHTGLALCCQCNPMRIHRDYR